MGLSNTQPAESEGKTWIHSWKSCEIPIQGYRLSLSLCPELENADLFGKGCPKTRSVTKPELGWNNRVQGLFPKPHSVRKKVLWEDYPGVGMLTRSTYALKYPFPAKNVQPMLNNFMSLSFWLSPGTVLPQHRLPVGCHLRWHGWELFEALFTADLMLQMLPHECFHCGHNNLFKIKHIMIT